MVPGPWTHGHNRSDQRLSSGRAQMAISVVNWQSLTSRGAQLAIGDIIILFTAATAPIAADCSDLQGLNKCLLLN